MSTQATVTAKGQEHWTKKGDVKIFLFEKPATVKPVRGTVLFIHGSSMASTPTFDLQVPGRPCSSAMDYFASQGYDTWCFDMEGYGRSDKTRDINCDISNGADDAKAATDYIMKTRGVKDFLVYGISSGALRAAMFAERHPERVARLVVQSLVTRANPATRDHMLARATEVERKGMRAQAKASLDRSYPEVLRTGSANQQARFENYRARWISNDPHGFAAINRMLLDMNIEAELANITAPTLLIGCKQDVLRPPPLVQALSKLIANVRYVEADSGHFMHAQSPALFTQLAVPFLLEK